MTWPADMCSLNTALGQRAAREIISIDSYLYVNKKSVGKGQDFGFGSCLVHSYSD